MLSDVLFEIGMVLTPLPMQQAPLLLPQKDVMLLDTTTGPDRTVTEYRIDFATVSPVLRSKQVKHKYNLLSYKSKRRN